MRKISFLLLAFLFAATIHAQITVTVTNPTNTTPNLAASYPSLALALTDLNNVTAMSGPVILTCTAGGSETAPATGFTIGSATLNTVLSATNTVTINKSGGTVTLNAGIGTATPATVGAHDGILNLVGADWITIDGLSFLDGNAANPATMEYGIGLFKASATDGCQNNTIKNCSITLNRINNATGGALATDGSKGINVVNSTPAAQTVVVTVTAASGSNSNNKIYSNTIQNCNIGIALIGFAAATPFTLADTGNDVGGASAGTGNQVLNFGGAAAATNAATGIRTLAQYDLNISYNTVISNNGSGVNHVAAINGILAGTATSASATINNNTVSLQGGGTTAALVAISNAAGSTAAGNTISINNNTITGVTYTTATSGTFTGIVNSASAATVNINGNQLTSNATNAASGTNTQISNTGLPTVALNVNNNNINGWLFNAAAATSAVFNGINSTVSPVTATQSISNNNFQAITYTASGTGAHNYILYNSATSTTCTINNNTFTNLNVNTTGSVTFVTRGTSSMTATGSESFSNNQVVTGFTKGGAGGTVTGWTVGGGGSSINGSTMLQNLNNFSNITLTGATAFIGITNSEGASSSSGPTKTITNNTFNNITTGAGQISGILYNFAGDGTTISNNTLTNLTGSNVILAISAGTSNGGATQTISGNMLNNLTTAGQINGIQTGFGAVTTGNITGNTITNLSSTSAAANPIFPMIVSGFGVTTNISKNKIGNVQSTGNALVGSVVFGILAQTAGTNYNISNNIVGDLRLPANPAANNLQGISIGTLTAGTTVNLSYNTVLLNENVNAVAGFGSSAISASTTPTVNLRNNILVNTSNANTTGLTVAYRRSSTALATYGALSNNNDFYAGTPGANNLIFNDGTNSDQTIAAYKVRVGPRDGGSLTENPPFLSTTASNANFLHISTAIATQVESGAAPIAGITDDFDSQVRNVSTPDMGADEFAGILLDLTAPSISYTVLPNTSCATNPTLIATITDATGVNSTAGTKPRLWYRKGSNANAFPATNTSSTDGWKYVEATNASSPFTFTFDYSLLNGGAPVSGDVIHYFVVAQDIVATPNLGINAGTFTTAPPTVALNAGAFPVSGNNSFSILAPISTSVTIGAAGTYPTLTGTGGLFAALNAGALSGNTVATILDASVTEPGTNALNQIAYGCSGVYTLTIKPAAAVTPVLSGNFNGALVRILSSNVIIDGSNNGTTSRDLTITNTSVTTPNVVMIGSTGATSITNVTLKNSNIINGVNTSSAVVVSDAATLGNPGNFTNITIQNNAIQKAFIGVYCTANPVVGNGNGLNIVSNNLAALGANQIRLCGIYVQGTDGATISQNTVGNFETATSESKTGIWMATGAGNTTVSGNIVTTLGTASTTGAIQYGIRESSGLTTSNNNITGNTITNIFNASSTSVSGIDVSSGGTIIQKNNISNIKSTNTGTHGAYGINIVSGNNCIIRNNFVSDVSHDMTGGIAFSTTFGVFGIRIAAGTGHKVYHNSVNLFGLMPGTANTSLLSAAFALVSTASTGCDVRNNIFANNITGGTTSVAAVSAFLPSGGGAGMGLTWNNNAYYYGTDAARQGVGQAGTTAGTNFYTTLAALTAYSNTLGNATNDNRSSANTTGVPFVSGSDLHIDPAAASCNISNAGAALGVVDDIDGNTRNTLTPDIGADEYVSPTEPTITLGANPAVCLGATTANLTYSATTNAPNQYSIDFNAAAEAQGFVDVTNVVLPASPIAITVPGAAPVGVYNATITVRNTTTGCSSTPYAITITINPNNTITLTSAAGTDAQTVCINTAITPITYSTTGATGATFSGLPAGVTGNWAANVVTISGTPTASGTFNYTVTLTGGCAVVTATGSINVTPNNTITLTSAAGTNAQTVCINTAITPITYSTTGATGATFSGLPAGVTGNWAANVVTISGTPTASGTFNYTVTLTGGCGVITATGSINVTANNTIVLTSAGSTTSQTVCMNNPITNITYATTGATGASFSGLPSGVTGNWAANVVTISGAPTASGLFNYTVTLTGGCGVVTANGSINVNPLPTIGSVVTQPSTCVSADGAINLTISGAAGPYTFNWSTIGGSGLVPGVEDQSGLTVGQYTVVVTAANTCQQTVVFNLTGPGGCSICPTISTLTTSPTPTTCAGSTVSLNASGLAFMGVTYGITFKYSAVPLADPYTGGTVIATVPNGSLGGGGTTASTTTTFAAGNYIIYAILSPTPIDPFCRPAQQVNLVVNYVPTVNAIANQVVCNGALTTAVNFSGVPGVGTTYSWTNTNTSIGLAASGSNAPAIVLPVSATTTMGSGFGTSLANTFNGIGLSSFPSVQANHSATIPANSWASNGVTTGSITFNLGSTTNINGFAFWNQNGGGPGALGSTGIQNVLVEYSTDGVTFFTVPGAPTTFAQVTGSAELAPQTFGFAPVGAAYIRFNVLSNYGDAGQSGFAEVAFARAGGIPAFVGTNPGTAPITGTITVTPSYTNAGTTCTGAPATFTITVNPTPTVNAQANQSVCAGATTIANFTGAVAGTVYNWTNTNTAIGLGASGTGNLNFTATNAGITPITGTITVTPSYTNGGTTCTGTPITFTITVNPTPTAVATPSSQTICSGSTITTIVLTGGVSGTTYNWTRNNTVAVTGIGASGSGNISGALTNTTTAPVTVTFTITPTANGCPGTPITATVLVNPTPNAVATPSSQTICSGSTITTIALTSGVSGTTFNWTRNNTVTVTGIPASGSGNISGALTNTTNAPVTVTFTITPTANGCPGTPITATVIVNPTPDVTQGNMQVIITGNGNFADEITWTLKNSLGTTILSGGPYGFDPPPTASALAPATNAPFSFFIEAQGTFNDNGCLWEVRCNGNIVASGCIQGTNNGGPCPSVGTLTVNNISGCGSNLGPQTICSGSAITPITLSGSVSGTTFNWVRNNTATVTGIPASGTGTISGTLTNTTNAPVVVTFTITPSANGCNGTPVNVNITVNPIPNAVATPASQTVCSATPITPIVLSSAVSGTTYSWTRNNTATVTGIAASGTGNISGTLTNTTVNPITVTFTITPSANGCTGAPITATVTVNTAPTITCPANIVVPSVVGGCTAVVNFTPIITGTPAPTITYVLTGATTGSGSGTGSGLAYNVGVTTVTLSASNGCAPPATCSFTITVTDSQLPVISVQPVNRTVCAGTNATFNVTASNVLTYQWQQWNGSAWVNVAGATASSFTLTNVTVSQNTNTYRVVLNGLCTVVPSNAATLYVNPTPTVVISASPPASILPGQTTTLIATPNPAGGSFAWYFNGSAIPGASASTLGPLSINDLGTYRVIYTSAAGCPVTSANFEVTGAVSDGLWVYPNPNRGQFQVRFYNGANETATIMVFNAGGQKVFEQKAPTGGTPYSQMNVDLGLKANGVYIVQVVNGAGKILGSKRIIVQVL